MREITLPEIEICGIPFKITTLSNGAVALDNEKWRSFCAVGETTQEAIEGIFELLPDILEQYVNCSIDGLSADAIEFRNYLIQKMSPATPTPTEGGVKK